MAPRKREQDVLFQKGMNRNEREWSELSHENKVGRKESQVVVGSTNPGVEEDLTRCSSEICSWMYVTRQMNDVCSLVLGYTVLERHNVL